MFADFLYKCILLATVHTSNHICNTPSQCNLETIQCIDDEPCLIECSDNYSCKESTIICPKNDICNVQCIGNEKEKQCENIHIAATDSTILLLNVSSTFDLAKTMRDAYIYCPYNQQFTNKPPNCLLHCTGAELIKKTTIYAVNGFNDIGFTSTDICYKDAQIQCNRNYTETCSITNQQPFQCEDKLSPCQSRTHNPTFDPTIYPTFQPIATVHINTTMPIDLTISTINNDYSTTIELKIPFISWHNNTFMTIIVVAVICSLLILLAIFIVCLNRAIQIKNEANEIAFPHGKGMDRHDSFHDNERAQLNQNKNKKSIDMNRTEIKEHIGEYDIVLSFPSDSD